MILPVETIEELKAIFAEMGAQWSEEREPDALRPVCIASFRTWHIGIYKDGTEIGEIKAVIGVDNEFQKFLEGMLHVDDGSDSGGMEDRPTDHPSDERTSP